MQGLTSKLGSTPSVGGGPFMFGSSKGLSVFLLLAATSLVSLSQASPKSRILQTVDGRHTAVVKGSAHPLAKPENDAGRVDGSIRINGVSLIFKPSPSQQEA